MKKYTQIIISIIFTVFAFTSLAFTQEVLDRIAAIVDDDIILESEVTQNTYLLAMQLQIDPTKDPAKFLELQKQTLENLIIRHILLTKAEEDTVIPDQARVDAYVDEEMAKLKNRLGSDEKIEEQFGQPIKKVRRDYEEEIKKNFTIQMLREEKFVGTTVSRREIHRFFETNKDSLPEMKDMVEISHIQINPKPGEAAKAAARERMVEIKKRLDEGADFAELAKQVSDDPGSGQRGGDLGFIERGGGFVLEFEEAAFALEPGEVSDIVETQFGFHIIELLERRGDRIHTRHILVGLQTTSDDEKAAAERIKEIAQRVKENGEDFAEVAKEVSMDPTTSNEGGYLSWHEIETLQETAKSFVTNIRNLKPGEISDPFKSQFGFHVIKLINRREARPYDLDQDWDMIENYALNAKKQQEFDEWIAELRSEMYIEIKER